MQIHVTNEKMMKNMKIYLEYTRVSNFTDVKPVRIICKTSPVLTREALM